ncbi:tail completion protein gp17 [Gimesia maris]|uniref:tail completion protein gp17 n=1 Tax=Gimesia maris TaxID=122 RepID=UPI0030D7332A|tara:strand:- start:121817 stop:122236 length:420 start_codon:yes stop_codon:yes gene_type:complete
MIEKALYQYLSDQTSITDITGTRIYPHHLPQSVTSYPVLTITLVSNSHGHHLTSASGETTARVQLDSWSESLSDAVSLAEAVRGELQGFSGTMDTVTIHFIQLDNEQNLSEPPIDASDDWMYRKSQDFLVKYSETIPSF